MVICPNAAAREGKIVSEEPGRPAEDTITPEGMLSIDMSTFTIDQTNVDRTCGINPDAGSGLSA